MATRPSRLPASSCIAAVMCLIPAVALASPPILNQHAGPAGSLTVYRAGATPVQGVLPEVTFRGVALDGGLVLRPGFGWSCAGEPFFAEHSSRWFRNVDLATGRLRWTESHLSLPAHVPWPVGISYIGAPGAPAVNGYQGWNWAQTSQPELVVYDDDGLSATKHAEDLIYIVYGAAFLEFRRLENDSDAFVGVNGCAGLVVFEPDAGGPDTYTYYDLSGAATTFFAPEVGAQPWHGQLWKVADAAGRAAYVGDLSDKAAAAAAGFDASGRVLKAYDSADRQFTYTYANLSPGVVRLESVVARTKTGGTWGSPVGVQEVGRVEYAYAASTDAIATLGDLIGVTITTPLSDAGVEAVFHNHYRYWRDGDPQGAAHSLRLVTGYEGARRFDGSDGQFNGSHLSPSVTDDALGEYSVLRARYDSSGRVERVWLDGVGDTTTGDGAYEFAYEVNPTFVDVVGHYVPAWQRRTVIERPLASPGSTETSYYVQYFDKLAQPLSTVITNADPALLQPTTGFWATGVVRDADGRVEKVCTPAAVEAYYHDEDLNATPPRAAGTLVFRADDGLIVRTERISEASPSHADYPLNGFVRGLLRSKGQGGSVAYDLHLSYGTAGLTLGDATLRLPYVTAARRFPVETDDPAEPGVFEQTASEWTFWTVDPARPDLPQAVLVPFQRAVTHPAVPTEQNGPGTSLQSAQWFDRGGAPTFSRSTGNRVDYLEYDAATGLLTKSIRDADTAQLSGVPSGLSSTAGAMHLITSWLHDAQGRIARSTAPDGKVSLAYYTRLADRSPVTVHVPLATMAGQSQHYVGPALVTGRNHAGRATLSGLLSLGDQFPGAASLWSTTTAPHSWFDPAASNIIDARLLASAGFVRLWTGVTAPSGARLLEGRVYHQIPTSGMGAPLTHYDTQSLGYDALGRLTRVVDPSGTVTRVRFDAIDRPVELFRGTSDAGFPSGGHNLVRVASFQYDSGSSGGNSLLTQRIEYPNANGAAPRVTSLFHDYRGQLGMAINPEAPHAIFGRDNLGRVNAVGLYGAIDPGQLSGIPDPRTFASGRLGLRELFHDVRGQAYRDRTWEIDPLTGQKVNAAIPGPGYLENNFWFGAHGSVRARTGSVIAKYSYDRVCRPTETFILAQTSSSPTYASMLSVSTTTDIVLRQTLGIYDPLSGSRLGAVLLDRNPVRSGDPIIYGPMFTPTIRYTGPNEFELDIPRSIPARPNITVIRPDLFGRPEEVLYWCTAGIPGSGPGIATISTTVSSPTSGLMQIYRPRYDEAMRPRGTQGPLPFQEVQYDAAGRPTHVHRMEAYFPPYEPGAPWPCDPGRSPAIEYVNFTYDRGRLVQQDFVFGPDANSLTTQRMQVWYPDHYQNLPSFPADLPTRQIFDNNLPVAMALPGSTYSGGSSLSGATGYSFNALGELIGRSDPAGNVFEYVRDLAGRLSSEVTFPATGFDPIPDRRDYDYDPMGRLTQVSRTDRGTNTVLDDVRWAFSGLGQVDYLQQAWNGPISTPVGGNDLQFQSKLVKPLLEIPGIGEVQGWQRVRLNEQVFPGSWPVGMVYRENLPATPMSEPRLDYLISRPSSIVPGGVQNGSPYANYGYLGIYEASWNDFPNLKIDRPIYTPDGWFPYDPPNQPTGMTTGRFNEDLLQIYQPRIELNNQQPRPEPLYWVKTSYDYGGHPVSVENLLLTRPALPGAPATGMDSTFGFDCRGRPVYCSSGTNPRNFDHGSLAYELAPRAGPSSENRLEVWWYDAAGNWEEYWDDRDGALPQNPRQNLGGDDVHWERACGVNNQVTQLSRRTGSPAVTVQRTPLYDANGNLIDDAFRFLYRYDARGQLIEVHRRNSNGTQGLLFARFTYNALGWRTTAAYDVQSVDGNLDNEILELYQYDPQWRVVAIWRQGPVGSGTGTTPARPPAKLYQRYLHHAQGADGMGDARLLDAVVLMQRDGNGDGVFEREVYYAQNRRGDVVAVMAAGVKSGRVLEHVRYTVYGLPACSPNTDITRNMVVDLADKSAFDAAYAAGDLRADINSDGVVDKTDLSLFTAELSATLSGAAGYHGVLSRPDVDSRIGYAGYLWDPHLEMYHVRHRVYDPRQGRFLQPDPILFAGGLNLYEYAGGMPWAYIDPLGLEPEPRGFWYYMWNRSAQPGTEEVMYYGPYTADERFRMQQGWMPQANLQAVNARLNDQNDFTYDGIADQYTTRVVAVGTSNAQLGANVATGIHAGIFVVAVVAGGPDDLVIAGVIGAAAKGFSHLQRIGSRWFAVTKTGDRIPLNAAQTTRIDELVASGQITQRRGTYIVDETWGKAKPTEAALGREMEARGHQVVVRGGNDPRPDLLIDGIEWELKTITGSASQIRKRVVEAGETGRTRVILDLRGSDLTQGDAVGAIKWMRYNNGEARHGGINEYWIISKDGERVYTKDELWPSNDAVRCGAD